MYRWRTAVSASAILMVAAACASTGGSDVPRTSSTRISAEELAELEGQVNNLHDVVSRLRPRWLQGRIVVYQNQTLIGSEQDLNYYGLDAAYYLTYLDRSQAVAQLPGLGSRRIDGAIVMHTQ